jgi:hypothetical protein
MPDSIPQVNFDFSKRYWLFAWVKDNALGGINDFKGSFDTLNKAKNLDNIHDVRARATCGVIWDSLTHKDVSWIDRLAGTIGRWSDYV